MSTSARPERSLRDELRGGPAVLSVRSTGIAAPVRPTYRFFAGPGGVGKTTCAASAALAAADAGRRVLLASTDPAHSLGDVLRETLSDVPAPLHLGPAGLFACELDSATAFARWLAPRRDALRGVVVRGTLLDEPEVERLLRRCLPGLDELVALLELERLSEEGAFDEVLVDTAPIGHTARLARSPAGLRRAADLLEGMQARHRALGGAFAGSAGTDVADDTTAMLAAAAERLNELLRDPARCRFVWVLSPELDAVEKARAGITLLEKAGIGVEQLVVNRVAGRVRGSCSHCLGRARSEDEALSALQRAFPEASKALVRESSVEPRGTRALRALARVANAPEASQVSAARPAPRGRGEPRLGVGASDVWLDAIAPPGLRLLAIGGKGGVGKTTCAAALALALARRDPTRSVLLCSADPAHSIGRVLGLELGDAPRPIEGSGGSLLAREPDAARFFEGERERYRGAVDALFEQRLGRRADAIYERALLSDLIDLAPPGLDELLVLLEVLQPPQGGAAPPDLLVLDTPATGQALRLLAMPEQALSWVHALLAILLEQRELLGLGQLARDLMATAARLRDLQELLRDGGRARFVPVTRGADLPRLETLRLVDELARLDIAVPGIIANAVASGDCRRCARRATHERARQRDLWLEADQRPGPHRLRISAPHLAPAPRGARPLLRWIDAWRMGDAALT